jgi:ABC-type multidrug transport system fused ATPase/permease subunit
MPDKKIVIIGGAWAITLLMNVPRLLVMLFRKDIAQEFGFSYSDILLRTAIMFCFSWLVLSFNITWKKRLDDRYATLTSIAINALLLFVSVIALTFFKQFISEYLLDAKSFFFVTLFTHLIVLIILWLLAWLVHLTSRFQENVIEKEQAKRKALHHQLEVLRSQINPHFLFNTLNSLQ